MLNTILLVVFLGIAVVATVSLVLNILTAIRERDGAKRGHRIRMAVWSLVGTLVAAVIVWFFRSRTRAMEQDWIDDYANDDIFVSPGVMSAALM